MSWFWNGTLPEYARLLKVAYLTIEQADPDAQVIFAGLANNPRCYAGHYNYYDEVLKVFDGDPLAGPYGYFHDILATHNYFYSWMSWHHTYCASQTMLAHGLPEKPIWLNETGVPAWNDYPGPVWDPQSGSRSTLTEQADYIIQSGFYAAFAGVDAYFHFQLYDGCGNQPAGTDFPPHNGELCDENGELIGNPGFPCGGDANGLFSNPTDAACFRQHPQPETARPNMTAFQVLNSYLQDVSPYWRERPGTPCPDLFGNVMGGQELVAFYQSATQQRIIGMWARCSAPETVVLPATSPAGTATLVSVDGSTQTLTAQNGVYTIQLPGATNQNPFPDGTVPSLTRLADGRIFS